MRDIKAALQTIVQKHRKISKVVLSIKYLWVCSTYKSIISKKIKKAHALQKLYLYLERIWHRVMELLCNRNILVGNACRTTRASWHSLGIKLGAQP